MIGSLTNPKTTTINYSRKTLSKGLPTKRLTDSITSRKTSFLRYFTPSPLHETAFVKATGGLGAPTSNL